MKAHYHTMFQKLLLLFSLFLPLLLFSNIIHKKLNIILGKSTDIVLMDDYFQNVELVNLNVPDSIVIGQVSAIYKYDKFYIIVDKRYSKSIFMFDNKMNFLRKIKKYGYGPEEYTKILTTDIDEKKKRFFIFDRKRVNVYSLPDFKFIKTIDLSGMGAFADMTYFNNYIYLYSISNFSKKIGLLGRVDLTNDNIDILIEKIPEILDKTMWSGIKHFTKTIDNLFFIPAFSNKIYNITKTGDISIKYEMINNKLFPDYSPYLNKSNNIKNVLLSLSGFFTTVYSFQVLSNGLFCISLPLNKKMQYIFFRNGEQNTKVFENRKISFDTISTTKMYGSFVYNNLGKYIESVFLTDIKAVLENGKKQKNEIYTNLLNKLLYSKAKNVPILLIFKNK